MDRMLFWFRAVGVVSSLVAVVGLICWVRLIVRRERKGREAAGSVFILGLAVTFLAYIMYPVLVSAHVAAGMTSCQRNLKQIGTALAMYADENGDRYPAQGGLASAARYMAETYRCPNATSAYTYAMNKHIAGVNMGEIDDPDSQVVAFECDAPTPDFMGDAVNLPKVPRHLSLDCFVFAAGNVAFRRRKDPVPDTRPLTWVPSLHK